MDNPEDKKLKKKHICSKCGKKFNRPAHLHEHMQRAHEGIRYQCIHCHKHFSTESYRNQHQRQCQNATFTCIEFGQEFRRVLELQTHRINVHQQPGPSGTKRKQRSFEVKDAGSAPKRLKQRSQHYDVDPLKPDSEMLPAGEDELSLVMKKVYQEHWSSIRSHHHTGRVQDVYNYRITDFNLHSLVEELQQLFQSQTVRFKINASFGFILRHVETGELCYYHSSHNQGRLLDVPPTITNQQDFDNFMEDLLQEDILEWVRQQRQDTKWIVVFVTNLSQVVRIPSLI